MNKNLNVNIENIRMFQNEEGLKIVERKSQLEERLLEFEKQIFEKWKTLIVTIIPECMSKNLLTRSVDKLLVLNFDEMVSFIPVTYCFYNYMKKHLIHHNSSLLL